MKVLLLSIFVILISCGFMIYPLIQSASAQNYTEFGEIHISQSELKITRTQSPVVVISGIIYSTFPNEPIKIAIYDNTNLVEQFSAFPKKDGEFNIPYKFSMEWLPGDYVLKASYAKNNVGTVNFSLSSTYMSEHYNESSDITIKPEIVSEEFFLISPEYISLKPHHQEMINVSGHVNKYLAGTKIQVTIFNEEQIVKRLNLLATGNGDFSSMILIDHIWKPDNYNITASYRDKTIDTHDFVLDSYTTKDESQIIEQEPKVEKRNQLNISKKEISIQEDDEKEIMISGTLSDYTKGRVIIFLNFNDRVSQIIQVTPTSEGDYHLSLPVNIDWKDGEYDIIVKYKGQVVGQDEFKIYYELVELEDLEASKIYVDESFIIDLESARIETNSDMYKLGEDQILRINGVIPDYHKGEKLEIELSNEQEVLQEFSLRAKSNGEFASSIFLNPGWKSGTYTLKTSYLDNEFSSTNFEIISDTNEVIEESRIAVNQNTFTNGNDGTRKLLTVYGELKQSNASLIPLNIIKPNGMYSFQIISQDDGSFSFSMMIDNTWQLGTYKVFTITNGKILGPVIFSVQEKLDQIIDPLTRQSKFGVVSIDSNSYDIKEDMTGVVKISGIINDYSRGTKGLATLTDPDGIEKEFTIRPKSSGEYNTAVFFDKHSKEGDYILTTYYNNNEIANIGFSVKIILKEKVINEE